MFIIKICTASTGNRCFCLVFTARTTIDLLAFWTMSAAVCGWVKRIMACLWLWTFPRRSKWFGTKIIRSVMLGFWTNWGNGSTGSLKCTATMQVVVSNIFFMFTHIWGRFLTIWYGSKRLKPPKRNNLGGWGICDRIWQLWDCSILGIPMKQTGIYIRDFDM